MDTPLRVYRLMRLSICELSTAGSRGAKPSGVGKLHDFLKGLSPKKKKEREGDLCRTVVYLFPIGLLHGNNVPMEPPRNAIHCHPDSCERSDRLFKKNDGGPPSHHTMHPTPESRIRWRSRPRSRQMVPRPFTGPPSRTTSPTLIFFSYITTRGDKPFFPGQEDSIRLPSLGAC